MEGKIVLISVQPFPTREGLKRIVISRIGSEITSYRYNWLSEKRIQEMFKDAGMSIPKPVAMPAPPEEKLREPLMMKLSNYFFGFTDANGISREIAWLICYGLWGLPIGVSIIMGAAWVWRRFRSAQSWTQ